MEPVRTPAPDVPVFRLDEVHRMQADLSQHAERLRAQPPTARAVSLEAGQHQSWATSALKEAVEQGLLTCSKEKVPRVKQKVDVYRPIAADL